MYTLFNINNTSRSLETWMRVLWLMQVQIVGSLSVVLLVTMPITIWCLVSSTRWDMMLLPAIFAPILIVLGYVFRKLNHGSQTAVWIVAAFVGAGGAVTVMLFLFASNEYLILTGELSVIDLPFLLMGILGPIAIGYLVLEAVLACRTCRRYPACLLLSDSGYGISIGADLARIFDVPYGRRLMGKQLAATLLGVVGKVFQGLYFWSILAISLTLPTRWLESRIKVQEDGIALDPMAGLTFLIVSCIILFLGSCSLRVGNSVIALSRRLGRRSLEELLQSDHRRPILLLRSFRDDHVSFEGMGSTILRSLAPMLPATDLEDLLVRGYSHVGPVVAIGNPRDQDQPVGATRTYIDDNEWHARALALMKRARWIIAVVEVTDGLLWEVEQIVANRYREKTVFVFPPRFQPDATVVVRLRHILGVDIRKLFDGSRRPVVLISREGGTGFVLVSDSLTEFDYHLSLRAAFYGIWPVQSSAERIAGDSRASV